MPSLIGSGFSGPAGPGLVANGGTIVDNNFQMNGVGINDLQSGAQFTGGIAIPNPDTIEEFKVQTSQYDASFGRNAGANVDVVTRSGTTDFHGGAWEFFRNDALDANTFFRNRTGQARPVLKQNQFGFDLGGPIRKEKLLFFISYQGTRQRNGVDANCSSQINSPPISNDRSPAALGQLFAGQRGVIQTTLGVGPAVAPAASALAIKTTLNNVMGRTISCARTDSLQTGFISFPARKTGWLGSCRGRNVAIRAQAVGALQPAR